ncbi:GtrA family protein [Halobium salinum]|uniref:GtrA family protein n=1 Tax=Halobium salinum TaxID=1364940 RepID=A0ABD5PCH5_9EURY|nr:GtrA family protein [Halobium salinum]
MSNRDAVDELVSGVRFGKFLSVGAVGAVFDLTVSTLLLVVVGIGALSLPWVGLSVPPGVLAKLVGAEVAIVIMFFINEYWTFADESDGGPWPRRLAKSNFVRVGGLGIQVTVVWLLGLLDVTLVVAGFDFWQVAPFPLAIAASVLFNYVAESLFTWRVTAG